jgi:hypothetical protein
LCVIVVVRTLKMGTFRVWCVVMLVVLVLNLYAFRIKDVGDDHMRWLWSCAVAVVKAVVVPLLRNASACYLHSLRYE